METDPFSRALAALASPAVDPNARREAEAFVTAAGEDPAVVLALLRHLEPASAVAVTDVGRVRECGSTAFADRRVAIARVKHKVRSIFDSIVSAPE